MEFNAVQQYGPPHGKLLPAQQQNPAAAQMMYPVGTYLARAQTAQPGLRPHPPPQHQHQPYPAWSAAATSVSMQQPSTTAPENIRHHGLPTQPNPTRPLPSQTMQNLGLQNPRICTDFSLQQQPGASTDPNAWNQQKSCNEYDFSSLEPEMAELTQGLIATDEEVPIIDLRQYTGYDQESNQDPYRNNLSRRMSESSFSMSSTTGPVGEAPIIEDVSTSDISYASDGDWSGLEPAPQQLLSPMGSPRMSYHDMRRAGSRSRASPVPHNNVRTSPYTTDTNRNKRWSTGTYSSIPPAPHNMNRFNNNGNRYSFYGSPLNPNNGFPVPTEFIAASQYQTQNLYAQPTVPSSHPTLFSTPDHQFPEAPRHLGSQALFRLVQSNTDRLAGCASHFADLSDPPDLYSSLHEEPSNPPESDMNPSDPELTPHEQDLRFTDDLYTPRWVRGHGNKREGWCGLCKPGRWLVLKNSAFWYDKSFTHGVSAATGTAFQGPQETRRTEGNLDVWEGLCGSCGEWIPLVSSKKKGTTWFRHAYKCHTHPKVKDGAKRRRETANAMRARRSSLNTAYTATNATSLPAARSSSESLLSDSKRTVTNDDNNESPVKREKLSEPTPVSTPQLSSTRTPTPLPDPREITRLATPVIGNPQHLSTPPSSNGPKGHGESQPLMSQGQQNGLVNAKMEYTQPPQQHLFGYQISQSPMQKPIDHLHPLPEVDHGVGPGEHNHHRNNDDSPFALTTMGMLDDPNHLLVTASAFEFGMSMHEEPHVLFSTSDLLPAFDFEHSHQQDTSGAGTLDTIDSFSALMFSHEEHDVKHTG